MMTAFLHCIADIFRCSDTTGIYHDQKRRRYRVMSYVGPYRNEQCEAQTIVDTVWGICKSLSITISEFGKYPFALRYAFFRLIQLPK